MTTTLLTFLGRVPKGENGYRKTRYDFGDGGPSDPVAFLGWPLQERLGSQRLVIMGTAGSMWDHLFEGDLAFPQETEEGRLKLIDAVEKHAVTADLLSPLKGPLSERLGCKARLVLIPYCRSDREQVDLLRIMAEHVERGDGVHIDITHGFRHLPAIALLAALYLGVVRSARIRGIWYGAWDPDTNDAQVINLIGLLRVAKWIQALHTYDKDGDYGVFSPLLGRHGGLLERAAFFERTSNPVEARKKLFSWAEQNDRSPFDDPAAELFRGELEERISWYRRPDRPSWERELAARFLDQRDYVRAAIYGLEAVISTEIAREGGNVGRIRDREGVREHLRSRLPEFETLYRLRNAMAHGVRSSDSSIEAALKDEASLQKTLRRLLMELLNKQKSKGA